MTQTNTYANAAATARIAPAVREALEALHGRLHRRDLVEPDPLQFLYAYADPADREIVATLASGLAYGRVKMILRNVGTVLDHMKPSPSEFVRKTPDARLRRVFANFRHRFTGGEEIASLLGAIRRIVARHGSLRELFLASAQPEDETVLPALAKFVAELRANGGDGCPSLLSSPADGSACKRMNLMLRWLVRHDNVDPGGWEAVGAHRLVMPLDTHIHRICRELGLTQRRQADLRTALEVTAAFREIAPDDPTRYDFALSRLGIRKDTEGFGFQVSGTATGRTPTVPETRNQQGRASAPAKPSV